MILVAAVTVLAVRIVRKKKRIHNDHIHDNTSQYNMVSNRAYDSVPVSRNERVDDSQEDVVVCEELSCIADRKATEEDDSPYERIQDYEPVNDPYERVQV